MMSISVSLGSIVVVSYFPAWESDMVSIILLQSAMVLDAVSKISAFLLAAGPIDDDDDNIDKTLLNLSSEFYHGNASAQDRCHSL